MAASGTIAELHAWLDAVVTETDLSAGTLIMLCGIAGAGKTTAAAYLESRGCTRLSIDEEIWTQYGRFGIDYAPEAYPELQRRSASDLWARLPTLLERKVPVVVDNSFWNRESRDSYKRLANTFSRPWTLLYLKVSDEVLRARLLERRSRFDANAAFPISDDLLTNYLESFQQPCGEGEVVFE